MTKIKLLLDAQLLNHVFNQVRWISFWPSNASLKGGKTSFYSQNIMSGFKRQQARTTKVDK